MSNTPAILPTVTPDPALAAILTPGETIHWQVRPRSGGVTALIRQGIAATLVLAGAAVLVDIIPGAPATGFVSLAVGLLVALLAWNDRPSRWLYVLTSRRIMTVKSGRVYIQSPPGHLEGLRLKRNADGTTDLRWRNATVTQPRRRDPRRLGFLRLAEAEKVEALVRDWQAGFTAAATDAARAFTAATPDTTTALPPGLSRVINNDLGFRIDVPSGWTITVNSRHVGPLRILGITLLPRVIRDGTAMPWTGQTTGWNVLTLRGDQATGVDLHGQPGPLDRTLQDVLQDPIATGLGIQAEATDPMLTIGPWRGFAVTRHLPEGGTLTGFGPVPVPVTTRQTWLGNADGKFEIQGFAPKDAPDLHTALHQIVASLTPVTP